MMLTNHTMRTVGRDEVLRDLRELVAEIASAWGEVDAGVLTSDTQLGGDLGYQSVDLVMLFLAIESRYSAPGLPWESLLLVGGEYRKELPIGDLGDFLTGILAERTRESAS